VLDYEEKVKDEESYNNKLAIIANEEDL